MSSTYTLWCLIDGDKTTFKVIIPFDSDIADLKDSIKQKCSPMLDKFAAKDLILWKLKTPHLINPPKELAIRIQSLGSDYSQFAIELEYPTDEVLTVFPNKPPKDCLHIFVELPTHDQAVPKKRKRDEFEIPSEMTKLKTELGTVSPSALAKANIFSNIVGQGHATDCGRPHNDSSIPITLLCDAFGLFQDRCNEPPSDDAILCASELIRKGSEWYESEQARTEKVLPVFKLLNLVFRPDEIGKYKTDRNLRINVMPAAIRECKNEDGTAYFQVVAYYHRFLLAASRRYAKYTTRFPCILVTDIGAQIAFYGAVWNGVTVIVRALCPVYDLATDPLGKHQYTLASTLDAFKVAVDAIEAHYVAIQNEAEIDPTPTAEVPAHIRSARQYPYPTSFNLEGQTTIITYHERLSDKNLIFAVAGPNSQQYFVKYTCRYSEDAHKCLASYGFAPKLYQCTLLPGGWYVVIMGLHLSPYHMLATLSPDDEALRKVRSKVEEALGKLHAEGFVHGDVRDANILVDSKSLEGDVKIHIVDWDWAGRAGEVRYPPGINRLTVKRPEGAQTSKLIAKEHDLEMVDYLSLR